VAQARRGVTRSGLMAESPGGPPPPGWPGAPGGYPVPLAPAPVPAQPWLTRTEVRDAGVVAAVLLVVGVLAGVVWRLWATTTHGYDIGNSSTGPVVIPDETEGWIAADGHFLVVTAVVGLLAGPIAWRIRRSRGPVLLAGVVVGALLGALLTGGIGHLIGGGSRTPEANTNFIERLPLSVHQPGLYLVEAILAVGGYLAAVLFTARDDLDVAPRGPVLASAPATAPGTGLPWGVPPGPPADPSGQPSVGPEHGPQGLDGHGDGAGGLEQRGLPPQ
jgi:hypothetical protein